MTSLTTAWEWLRSHALATPSLAKFALGMVIIVGIPPLCRRIRRPAVVGLLLCGVVMGPHVLGIFGERTPIADFFAELGKLLLMFFAGLEIDIIQFRREQNKDIRSRHHLDSVAARHGRWALVRLSAGCSNRIRITARLAY